MHRRRAALVLRNGWVASAKARRSTDTRAKARSKPLRIVENWSKSVPKTVKTPGVFYLISQVEPDLLWVYVYDAKRLT